MPTVNSYFSGIGGMDLGLAQAGLDIIQSTELDAKRCEVLRDNFDYDVVCADVSQQTVFNRRIADVLVATWPCKRYSTMADISGTRTGDDLFVHFLRHVALIQPEAYAVENVPGMAMFPVVMEALSELPGYYVTVFCPVDCRWWLPQRRDRLILIATRRPFEPRPPSGSPMTVGDILEDDPDVHIPDYVQTRLDGEYRDKPIVVERDGIAPTCLAHYAKDRSTRLVDDGKRVRPFSTREWARLQGFPDDYKINLSDRQIYSAVGDAVPVPMGRWVGVELMRYFQ